MSLIQNAITTKPEARYPAASQSLMAHTRCPRLLAVLKSAPLASRAIVSMSRRPRRASHIVVAAQSRTLWYVALRLLAINSPLSVTARRR